MQLIFWWAYPKALVPGNCKGQVGDQKNALKFGGLLLFDQLIFACEVYI